MINNKSRGSSAVQVVLLVAALVLAGAVGLHFATRGPLRCGAYDQAPPVGSTWQGTEDVVVSVQPFTAPDGQQHLRVCHRRPSIYQR